MTTVFIGGSRTVSRLNEVIRDQLDDLIQKKCKIFIGDANGADRAVQQHFAGRGYGNVVVFCMDHCRNNVGNWSVHPISHPGGETGFLLFRPKRPGDGAGSALRRNVLGRQEQRNSQ